MSANKIELRAIELWQERNPDADFLNYSDTDYAQASKEGAA